MKATVANPIHWAARVPIATPSNPNAATTFVPFTLNPSARTMLSRMLIPFTVISATIALTLSCMPMNHPFRAIRQRVAGAAHILMKKYLDANARTSGVQSTTRKAAFTNIHCTAMRNTAMARDMASARNRMPAHSLLSSLPYA